jgi:hypothetical protein
MKSQLIIMLTFNNLIGPSLNFMSNIKSESDWASWITEEAMRAYTQSNSQQAKERHLDRLVEEARDRLTRSINSSFRKTDALKFIEDHINTIFYSDDNSVFLFITYEPWEFEKAQRYFLECGFDCSENPMQPTGAAIEIQIGNAALHLKDNIPYLLALAANDHQLDELPGRSR